MNPALLLLTGLTVGPAPAADLRTPPGFTAYLYADQPLANDIYTMTIDDEGRILVAGRGYVRVLADDDGDGRADRAVDLIDGLKDGPMGLLAEGDSLYVVVDGGLKRYRGYNGIDKLRGPPETILALKTSGEHDAHAVRRGPDGWLYWLCGNMAGMNRAKITSPRSPVKEPIAGSLVRISPDGTQVEVVADGFRNAYGFDFHPDGEPFTFDSENERCIGLPWYEGQRFYHIVPGGNHGWRSPQLSQTWRKPPYFVDVVPPIADLGRGSPTGVVCYRHTQFPQHYRGGFFLADWTFGRIYFVPLLPRDSSYVCGTENGKPEVFAESLGTSGFAPTGLAVHPTTGELFVSIGGRGTRGGVYRIRFNPGNANPKPIPVAKRSLEWDEETAKQWNVDALIGKPAEARRALELLLRHHEKVPRDWKLTRSVEANLAHRDPLIRAAAGRLAVASRLGITGKDEQSRLTLALAWVKDQPNWSFDVALELLSNPQTPDDRKLQALRIVQLALGDLTARNAVGTVWEGYTFAKPVPAERVWQISTVLHDMKSLRGPVLLEATRTLAGFGNVSDLVYFSFTRGFFPKKTLSQDDLHHLIVLGRVSAPQPDAYRPLVTEALLDLDRKMRTEGLTRDRHWPLRVEELCTGLKLRYPDLGEYVVNHTEFGRADHLVFVKPLGINRAAAVRKFIAVAETDPEFTWTPGLAELLRSLPDDEARPVLSKLWDRGGLEDALIPTIARFPQPDDRPKLLVGLRSLDPEVVKLSALALARIPPPDPDTDIAPLIVALRRLPDDKTTAATRAELAWVLHTRTGRSFGPDPKAWSEWLTKTHPQLARQLAAADGFDPVAWNKRAEGIVWETGNAERGRKAFVKATCAACHDGGGAVGPSLQGVGKRFGRDDLLTAIVQPNRDVSPRYRPTRVTTFDGQAHIGMIVYQATDGVILQTGPDATVRIAGRDIESQRTLDTSLMPAGLLDKLTDEEIADLLAYLQS